jgi:hypothetical protein
MTPEIIAAANRLLTEKNYSYWECNWKVNAMEDSALLAKYVLELLKAKETQQ